MIDDQHKLIFVENPKAASYAIKIALLGPDYIKNPSVRFETINHNVPSIIRTKFPKEWCTYIKFVVVRNTWDRAHSFFHFYQTIAGAVSYQSISFAEWVNAGCPPPEESHLRASMHGEGRFDDVLCQLRYCEGIDEIIVLQSFNPTSRQMELQKGLNRICSIVGRPAMKVPFKNSFGRSDQSVLWTQDTVKTLRNMYSDEIARFGFQAPQVNT